MLKKKFTLNAKTKLEKKRLKILLLCQSDLPCQNDTPCQTDAPCHFVAVPNRHTVSI